MYTKNFYLWNVISEEEAAEFGMKEFANDICQATLVETLEELPPFSRFIGEQLLNREELTNREIAEAVEKVYDVTRMKIATETRRVATILSYAIRYKVPWDYSKLADVDVDDKYLTDDM